MAWRRARPAGLMPAGWLAWSRATRMDGEGDPVGAGARVPGGLGFQGAERLAGGEEREQFLADQLRRPGPQDEAGAAQTVFSSA